MSAVPENQPLTSRRFVTSLINSLPPTQPSLSPSVSAEPSSNETKNIFLTLHVLFPNELLAALDLLDRGLVSQICAPPDTTSRLDPHPSITSASPPQPSTVGTSSRGPFYVRSAAAIPSSRSRRDGPHHRRHSSRPPSAECADRWSATTCYEVRLEAWSCSCPAFAFAAFPADLDRHPLHDLSSADAGRSHERVSTTAWDASGWTFGGLTRGNDLPVCKHLLACVLAKYGNAFGDLVRQEAVTMEELAGWAAGWALGV